jgi:uncharacterized protein YndB with AHSA1/START domain
MTNTPRTGAARALADLELGTIVATIEIHATPETVFRSLTTPEELLRWWGAEGVYRTTEWTMELRVGGKWRAGGKGADGQPFSVEGTILAIDPPRKLVQTWRADWDGSKETKVTYSLDPIADGTRITVLHEGFAGRPESCKGHGEGWELVLGWLSSYVSPASGRAVASLG